MTTHFRTQLEHIIAEYERVFDENTILRRRLSPDSEGPRFAAQDPNLQNNGCNVSDDTLGRDLAPIGKPSSAQFFDQSCLPGLLENKPPTIHAAVPDEAPPVFDTINQPLGSSRHGALSTDASIRDADTTSVESNHRSKSAQEPRSVVTEEDELLEEDSMKGLILLDVIPAFVILINAAVIGVSADVEPDAFVWKVFEVLFTTFFILEIACKMRLFGCRGYLCSSDWYWSWFDIFCVALALIDMGMTAMIPTGEQTSEDSSGGGGSLGALKMLKLARLGRIVRLLKFKIFIELKLMIQGVFTGLRVLFWAVVLLVGLMYLMGVMGKTLLPQYPEFSSVPAAMFTWFRCFTDGCSAYDGTPLQERVRFDYGGIWMMSYILVFLFVTIGIFNLIMAVFIDNVNDGSMKKKQNQLGLTAEKTEYTLTTTLQEKCLHHWMKHEKTKSSAWDRVAMSIQNRISQIQARYGRKSTSAKNAVAQCQSIKDDMKAWGIVIGQDVWNKWLSTDDELIEALGDAEIDLSSKYDLFDVLDADMSGELDFHEIVDGLMKCRGPVSKTDVIAIRLKVTHLMRMIMEIHSKLGCEKDDTKTS
eukprot:TRINITY_DN28752_c0_g1_i2.p1 TRINITY_DN28752_c0_g1~~TRINITY_DN28752_c0_g1_i2.p1  ORF type:complete len:588 (+),score=88.48 TRINITY_DN28752_c0_g1_i2:162-1925(+)